MTTNQPAAQIVTSINKPLAKVEVPVVLTPTPTPILKATPIVTRPNNPVVRQNTPVKMPNIVKPQPFRPSSMATFEVPQAPVSTLSLGDLSSAQPLNFKGRPDTIKSEKKNLDISEKESDGETLRNWPTGDENWSEGEEIDLKNQDK